MKTQQATLLLAASLLAGNAAAQMAVFDASNLQQSMQQYQQMVEQVTQLRAQLEQLKTQYQAITGTYGVGALMQGEALAAQSIVPGSWQDIVKLQQSGAYRTKMDYYEGLMKAVDPGLLDAERSTPPRLARVAREPPHEPSAAE